MELRMGWFNSNKDKESIKSKKDEIAKATYKVTIKERLGSSLRTVKTITAVRYLDEDDHVVYLQNEQQNFFEIFPEKTDQQINYTEKEVEDKLKALKVRLKKEKESKEPSINPKNLEFSIRKLEAIKRSFKFSKNGSYITFDENGKPSFYFLRHGSTFIPMKWDADTSTIYTPSDNKKKSAAIALRNKKNKYVTKDKMAQYSFWMLVIGVIFLFGSVYVGFKTFDKYSESEITEARLSCLTDTKAINAEIKATANHVNNIAKDLENELNKPQTVIDGIVPR